MIIRKHIISLVLFGWIGITTFNSKSYSIPILTELLILQYPQLALYFSLPYIYYGFFGPEKKQNIDQNYISTLSSTIKECDDSCPLISSIDLPELPPLDWIAEINSKLHNDNNDGYLIFSEEGTQVTAFKNGDIIVTLPNDVKRHLKIFKPTEPLTAYYAVFHPSRPLLLICAKEGVYLFDYKREFNLLKKIFDKDHQYIKSFYKVGFSSENLGENFFYISTANGKKTWKVDFSEVMEKIKSANKP